VFGGTALLRRVSLAIQATVVLEVGIGTGVSASVW
jgi:hypothetical protein